MSLPKPGDTFGIYKLKKCIGQGGMGQVFLAVDTNLSRPVAIKFLGTENVKPDESLLKRFENEAKVLAKLNHQNIVNIYNYSSSKGFTYLVMEYVEGKILNKFIEKRAFGVNDSLQVLKQIINALNEAHRNGVLHRDIKPANILINKNDEVKIVDFGISKNIFGDEQNLTLADHFVGTVRYMAPELLVGHRPSPSTDLYSVGIVFYELLTGQHPYNNDKKKSPVAGLVTDKEFILPDEVADLIPTDVQHILLKLISRNAETRYQSAADALEDIKRIDEDNMAEFLRFSVRPDLIIINREKCRLSLLKMGYNDSEARIIIKMAANIQEKNPQPEFTDVDATVMTDKTKHKKSMEITKACLEEAIDQFEDSRTKVSMKLENEAQNATKVQDVDFANMQLAPTRVSNSKNFPVKKPKKAKKRKTQKKKINIEAIPFPLYRPNIIKRAFNFLIFIGILGYIGKVVHESNVEPLKQFKLAYDIIFPEIQRVKKAAQEKQLQWDDSDSKEEEKGSSGKRKVSSIEKAPRVNPRVGSQFSFHQQLIDNNSGRTRSKRNFSVAVAHLKRDGFVANRRKSKRSSKSAMKFYNNATLPSLYSKTLKEAKLNANVIGRPDSIYPLDKGNKVDFSYRVLSGGQFNQYSRNCEVRDYKTISVAKREWPVFEIYCLSTSDNAKIETTRYYSPELSIVIKEEEVSQIGRRSQTRIFYMTGFKKP